jgi:catechol 2,3-dioxygenase-like lactoylglutathione lyase family enzyme
MLKFITPLIVVADIARSRQFYEDLLGQKVKFDFGENVTFEGDFAIHFEPHYQSLLGDPADFPISYRCNNAELYFETGNIETIAAKLDAADVTWVHAMRAQPWGQRVMRFYDPDGHIIEIGEPMEAVVWRFHQQGLSLEDVAAKSSMPAAFVEQVIRQHKEDIQA